MNVDWNMQAEPGDLTQMQLKVLSEDQWPVLRDVRLIALKDSPDCFLSNYDREFTYDEPRWRAEFERGEWIVAVESGSAVESGVDCNSTATRHRRKQTIENP